MQKLLKGYASFRKKYAQGDNSVMQSLAYHGQKPETMVVSCCDSRVDPAVILQCEPGELFVVRNIANIIPIYENDDSHHGTSAALEYGICFLKVRHLIILGHSQCGGIQMLLNNSTQKYKKNDFISNWVSLIKAIPRNSSDIDHTAKLALNQSYQNCLTFPWIKTLAEQKKLIIHLWFFDIHKGQIYTYSEKDQDYVGLD